MLKNIAQLIDLAAGDNGSSDVTVDGALALNWLKAVLVRKVRIRFIIQFIKHNDVGPVLIAWTRFFNPVS